MLLIGSVAHLVSYATSTLAPLTPADRATGRQSDAPSRDRRAGHISKLCFTSKVQFTNMIDFTGWLLPKFGAP